MPSSPIAQQPLDLMLTADRFGELLATCGYRGTMNVLRGSHALPAGFSLALQFGDQTSRDAHGVERPTIRASIVLSGSDRRAGEPMTRWQLVKFVPAFIDQTSSGFNIEADLLLGAAIDIDDLLVRGGELLRHLRLLIQDARTTLGALTVENRLGTKARAPMMRIEVRLAGGIVAGRSGIVREAAGTGTATVRTTMHHVLCGIAACDCLDDQILPELARATRATITQALSSQSARGNVDQQTWLRKQLRVQPEALSDILQ